MLSNGTLVAFVFFQKGDKRGRFWDASRADEQIIEEFGGVIRTALEEVFLRTYKRTCQ